MRPATFSCLNCAAGRRSSLLATCMPLRKASNKSRFVFATLSHVARRAIRYKQLLFVFPQLRFLCPCHPLQIKIRFPIAPLLTTTWWQTPTHRATRNLCRLNSPRRCRSSRQHRQHHRRRPTRNRVLNQRLRRRLRQPRHRRCHPARPLFRAFHLRAFRLQAFRRCRDK